MRHNNNGNGGPAGMINQHKEAFCLMWYACTCGHREQVWNSRDGVTPMFMNCPSCGGQLGHADWNRDIRTPNHAPHPGQLVWRNGTVDEAIAIVKERFRQLQAMSADEAKVMLDNVRQTARGNIKPGKPGFWHEFEPGWPTVYRHVPAASA